MGEQKVKIALIPPSSLLAHTQRTNYQLCLPHLLADARYYWAYKAHCGNPSQFVILDNGAAEGALTDPYRLLSHALDLMPDEVVIPDSMGNCNETIDMARAFHDVVTGPRGAELHRFPFKYMFVIQGQTLYQVLDCATWAMAQDWINTIGVPRHLIDTLGDRHARPRIANELFMMWNQHCKPIHFLGGNPNFPEEVAILANPRLTVQTHVRGMDTSMPFNYAYAKVRIGDEYGTVVHRPDQYFNLPATDFDDSYVQSNVQFFLQHHQHGVVTG